MKDPLDPRPDPYQAFSEEAQKQGLPALVFLDTEPMAIRRIFAKLRGQAQDPARLEEARSILTKAEDRLRTDIFFYFIGGDGELQQPLPEPHWEWERLLLPEMSQPRGLMQPVLGDEVQLLEPIEFKEIHLEPLPLPDDGHRATWEISFPL